MLETDRLAQGNSSMTETDSTASPQLPRSVWVLSWISFFADVSSEMVYPILPLFLVQVLGTSRIQLGLIEGAAVLLVALMSAYAGFRSDRGGAGGGRVRWIRIGYGMPVLGKAIIALASVWPLVAFGRLLDRFGKGLRGAPRDALIADAVDPTLRGRAFGLHRTFDTAGALLGVLLAALLLWALTGTPSESEAVQSANQTPEWVYRAILVVGGVLGLAAWGLSFLVPESRRDEGTSTADSAEVTPTSDRQLSPAYWSVLTVLGLFSLANSSDTFLMLRMGEIGFTPWQAVLLYAMYNVTYAGLSYPIGVLSDRLGRWKIIAFGWIIYSGVYGVLAWLPPDRAWLAWPVMGMYGFYMALTDGVGKALIADYAPRRARGLALGLFYATTGITTLAASLIAGWLWDEWGSWAAMGFGSVASVIAVVVAGLTSQLRRMPASSVTTHLS